MSDPKVQTLTADESVDAIVSVFLQNHAVPEHIQGAMKAALHGAVVVAKQEARTEMAMSLQASLDAQGLETARIAAREKVLRDRLNALEDMCRKEAVPTGDGSGWSELLYKPSWVADQLRAILEETEDES